MAKTKKMKDRLILDFYSGLHYKETYLGSREHELLKMNVGDDVLITVSFDNNVINVKPYRKEEWYFSLYEKGGYSRSFILEKNI